MDFEKKMQKLEEIVTKMEKGDIPLEESLKLFQEGFELSRSCQKELEAAELKVQKLLGFSPNGEPLIEEFRSDEQES